MEASKWLFKRGCIRWPISWNWIGIRKIDMTPNFTNYREGD